MLLADGSGMQVEMDFIRSLLSVSPEFFDWLSRRTPGTQFGETMHPTRSACIWLVSHHKKCHRWGSLYNWVS